MTGPAPQNADGTVLVEFRGGPMDGLTEFTTDSQPIRTFASPGVDLTAIMPDKELPRTDDVLPIREYSYRRTDKFNQQGARVYTYAGERARK
jgi:hypothetical protein